MATKKAKPNPGQRKAAVSVAARRKMAGYPKGENYYGTKSAPGMPAPKTAKPKAPVNPFAGGVFQGLNPFNSPLVEKKRKP